MSRLYKLEIDVKNLKSPEVTAKEKLSTVMGRGKGKITNEELDRAAREFGIDDKQYGRYKYIHGTGARLGSNGSLINTGLLIQTSIQTGKELVNTLTNIPGEIGNDPALQNKINNAKSVIGTVASGAMMIGSATMNGGPVGGAIAAVGFAATEAIKISTNTIKWNIRQAENNVAQTRSSERIGYIATKGNRNYV